MTRRLAGSCCLQQCLHFRPRIGGEIFERGPVRLRHAVKDGRLDRGPHAHAHPPVSNGGVANPTVRRASAAMEKASPGEVLATFQRLGHPRQELIVLR